MRRCAFNLSDLHLPSDPSTSPGPSSLPRFASLLLDLLSPHSPSAECRINFLHDFMVSSSGHLDLPHRAWVSLFNRASEAVKAASTPSKPFWGARIIYSTIRFIDPGAEKGQLRWYMEDCIALKREFPALIAGEFFPKKRMR